MSKNEKNTVIEACVPGAPTGDSVVAVLKSTTHYLGGQYREEKPGCPATTSYIGEYEDIVAVQFNQLKAKLFNLVESSTVDKTQQNAMKGLVKDFSNQIFKQTVMDLQQMIKRWGFQVPEAYASWCNASLEHPPKG